MTFKWWFRRNTALNINFVTLALFALCGARDLLRNEFNSIMHENCALLGSYAASVANSLPTIRDNVSIPSSRVKNPLKMGSIVSPETSIRNYQYPLHNNPEERSSHLLRGGSYSNCFRFYETRLWSANFATNCTDFHAIMTESFIADTGSRLFFPRKERLKIQSVPRSKHSPSRL